MAVGWKERVPLAPDLRTPFPTVHVRHFRAVSPIFHSDTHNRHGKLNQIGIYGCHAMTRNNFSLYEKPLIQHFNTYVHYHQNIKLIL